MKISKTVTAIALAALGATASLAQPFQSKGEVAGWNVF